MGDLDILLYPEVWACMTKDDREKPANDPPHPLGLPNCSSSCFHRWKAGKPQPRRPMMAARRRADWCRLSSATFSADWVYLASRIGGLADLVLEVIPCNVKIGVLVESSRLVVG